ncbi:MAG: saccharopine dehydrogenase NADP-binding domain-containing protein [Bacteroidales bacterium]|nr:saccharopine dehydrogenase NADP-binding domain-containing protein [Bacteroidales bacterium]
MKKILVLGAGLSASTLIQYFLDHAEENNWKLRLGDLSLENAEKKISNHPHGEAFVFDVNDLDQCAKEIKTADVVVSLLPARFHPVIADIAVELGVNMVTASYVSAEMKALDKKAKEKGVALLNELGVDPGIDHMSAMKVVDKIRAIGGKLLSFKSSTGGLVAPEYDNNPWNYKFTWNPRNVVLAGQGVSQYIQNGRYKYIPYHKLYERVEYTRVLNVGEFEIYPNRDSLSYRSIYELQDIPTMFRGTMRRPGYCEAWNVFVQLGMTDDSYLMEGLENMTWRAFVNTFLYYDPNIKVEDKLCDYLSLDPDGIVLKKLKWLGIFEDKSLGMKSASPAQVLQKLLEQKWALGHEDKDMIVMQHQFEYELDEQKHRITSSLVVMGRDTTHTAMSITVGTPVAIAVKLLLNGKLNLSGVHTPVKKQMYAPILEELEPLGIKFVEEEELIK